jgi:hypothetical protein
VDGAWWRNAAPRPGHAGGQQISSRRATCQAARAASNPTAPAPTPPPRRTAATGRPLWLRCP